MRWPTAWLSACSCALALAACGGSETAPPPPTLPAALAEQLAGRADAVAARLDSGDPCGAAQQAAGLQQAAIQALNRPGRIPAELREDLGVAVADLVDRAQGECAAAQPPPAPPPPVAPPAPTTLPATTTEEDQGGEERGRGKKGHGKRKNKDKHGGDG
jgi:hypothetical protein